MIFTRELLFLHVPKTGGMSVTNFLLEALPRPLYYTHPGDDPALTAAGVVQIKGIRHETLAEAVGVVGRQGLRLEDFAVIVAVLRNPYEMEVSRFAYLQKGHPWDAGPNQQLALAGNFEEFAIHSRDHGGPRRPIQAYFELDGAPPARLRVLRNERLESDLEEALRLAGLERSVQLPRRNVSRHDDFRRYYTPAAEEAAYRRYRWVFDQGFYPRMRLGPAGEWVAG